MGKISMELDAKEEEKLRVLKEKYGFKSTTELIRFLLTKEYEAVSKG